MKKTLYFVSAIALVAMFASCGSKVSTAKDIAKKECECRNLKKEIKNADSEEAKKKAQKEYDMCEYDLEIMKAEATIKYAGDTVGDAEAAKAATEVLKECK